MKSRRSKFFAYSNWDAILAIIPIFQTSLLLYWVFQWELLGVTSHLLIFCISSFLFYFNPIVVTHNFLHTPFFRSKVLNEFFAIYNSVNMGLPQVLYRHHHLLHHRYGNDPLVEGKTKDPSSTYRYGKNGKQEGFWSYCALGLFRDATSIAYAETKRSGHDHKQFIIQLVVVVTFHVFLLSLSVQWYVFAYIPLFLVGWFLAHLENYFEHFAATSHTNSWSNSVSYYNKTYNRFFFNEGYHQEHHIRPGHHWTCRPSDREKFLDKMNQNKAYSSSFPPLLGFLERGVNSSSSNKVVE